MVQGLLSRIALLGAVPSDSEDIRVRKSSSVLASFAFIAAGLAWGTMYLLFGEGGASSIPFGYCIASIGSLLFLAYTRRYGFFLFCQLSLMLLLPFVLMIALGGFVSGSCVVMWSLNSTVGALLFGERRHAWLWHLAFIVAIIISAILESSVGAPNSLPASVVNIMFAANVIGPSTVVYLIVRYYVGQNHAFKQQSESLLHNILPAEVIPVLKAKRVTIAEHFDAASIMFADVVGFTPLSEKLTPIALVEVLNEIFSHFDLLAEEYGLEKIKTIGDCYMAAAGVPRPCTDHAHRLTLMALDMHRYMASRDFGGHRLALRIGINSGEVVAGVIGTKKFSYDLWGDAVNTASRMESHGRAGAVQVSAATYHLIAHDFKCEPRGMIEVKGKGEMEVWIVSGPREANS